MEGATPIRERWPSRRPVLCAVTSRHRLIGVESEVDRLVAFIAAAAHAGLDLVQVREPGWEAGRLFEVVARGVAQTRGSAMALVVNDRIDVALAAQADGVHLREDSVSVSEARALVAPPLLVGRSLHSPQRVDDVDYVIAGTAFASTSKPGHTPLGERGLASIVAATGPLPVLAIGGVGPAQMAAIARTGAAGAAAIGCFADAWNSGESALARVVTKMREAWVEGPLVQAPGR